MNAFQAIKKPIQSYVKDESAVDEAVGKMILICVTIAACMGVGWFIWNKLQETTSKSSCTSTDSPWCIE